MLMNSRPCALRSTIDHAAKVHGLVEWKVDNLLGKHVWCSRVAEVSETKGA